MSAMRLAHVHVPLFGSLTPVLPAFSSRRTLVLMVLAMRPPSRVEPWLLEASPRAGLQASPEPRR
jgi:hypothetical protein